MEKEDHKTLAVPLLREVAQGATTQGDVEYHTVKAGSAGGAASHCDQVSSANSSDGERSASETPDDYIPAPHLVSVYAEDVRLQLSMVNLIVHVNPCHEINSQRRTCGGLQT